jgi:integrase
MRAGLRALSAALATNKTGGVTLSMRRGEGWWSVPELPKAPLPKNLAALHAEVQRRWGTIDLLDFLKEADYHTGFTDEFTSVASREVTPQAITRKRLLLALHGLATNIGIKRIASAGAHGETEATLRTTRHGCVSLLLSLGVPPRTVMQIVGHTVMEMTMERHGHVNLDDQRETLNLLDQELR